MTLDLFGLTPTQVQGLRDNLSRTLLSGLQKKHTVPAVREVRKMLIDLHEDHWGTLLNCMVREGVIPWVDEHFEKKPNTSPETIKVRADTVTTSDFLFLFGKARKVTSVDSDSDVGYTYLYVENPDDPTDEIGVYYTNREEVRIVPTPKEYPKGTVVVFKDRPTEPVTRFEVIWNSGHTDAQVQAAVREGKATILYTPKES